MLDYSTLKVIWWLLVGVLLLGFAIMDGHDMGVGTLLPVDVEVPGNPPPPLAILHGLLVAVGRKAPAALMSAAGG